MPRNEDLQKHTLNLYRGDYEKIQQLYPDLGAARAIRHIIRQFLDRCESEATNMPSAPVDFNL